MKILKALAIASAFSSGSIASAEITRVDIDDATLLTWSALGDLHACSLEFPGLRGNLAATKLDNSLHRLVRVSDLVAGNFDEIHTRKVELETRISVSTMKGMALSKTPESEIRQWCEDVITKSVAIQKRLEAKISSAEKSADRKSIVTERAKSKERDFVLILSLLFINTNTKDSRYSLQKAPVNRSFASENECMTYLSWRMSNTAPGIMGGGWVPHPSGKQIVCESR